MRPARFFTAAALLVLGLGLPPAARAETEHQWGSIILEGQKIGWFHAVRETQGEGDAATVRSSEEMTMKFQRMGIPLEITQKGEALEDARGRVLSFSVDQDMAGSVNRYTGRTEGDEVAIKTASGTVRKPYPAGALGQDFINQDMLRMGLRKGLVHSWKTFDKDRGAEAFDMKVEILDEKEEGGRKLWLAKMTMSHLPGMPVMSWIDAKGEFEKLEMPLGGIGTIEIVRSTEEEAKAAFSGRELFVQTLITPSRAIPDPTSYASAAYTLSWKFEGMIDLPQDALQQVVKDGDKSARVTVRVPPPPPAADRFKALPPSGIDPVYLKPAGMIESDDPLIVKMAQGIKGTDSDPLLLAQRLQRAVYLKIRKKNLTKAFASAAETARTLEGDCTEHAMLAAALARAMGLPSRVVCGVAYLPPAEAGDAKGVFGFHMWAEVMIAPDVWWPVDGALNRYDVTHIALVKSAMEGVSPENQISLALIPLIGSMKIEVLELEKKQAPQAPNVQH
jgi:hypothetical protein